MGRVQLVAYSQKGERRNGPKADFDGAKRTKKALSQHYSYTSSTSSSSVVCYYFPEANSEPHRKLQQTPPTAHLTDPRIDSDDRPTKRIPCFSETACRRLQRCYLTWTARV